MLFKNKNIPDWFLDLLKSKKSKNKIPDIIKNNKLHTVCQEARCPNRGECFSKGTATFLLLGDYCTRNCRFCAIKSGRPKKLDLDEPERIKDAVKELNLNYVVLTSVTRDDLEDGGAEIFAKSVEKIKKLQKNIKVEVLIPDFEGKIEPLKKVLKSKPDVFNHNLETVNRLYSKIRPEADYNRSLKVLENAKTIDSSIYTKSGIMVGLGENRDEVKKIIDDLKNVNCDILTIGQYIRPTEKNYPVKEYVKPKVYKDYKKYGEKKGMKIVAGPLVRSSYKAADVFDKIK